MMLPLSRLLNLDINSRSKEESVLPQIKAKRVRGKMEKRQDKEEIVEHTVKEEKVEESCSGKEVPSSGSTNFTLRSFPTGANPPSIQPLPHGSCLPPSPAVSPPLLTPPLFTLDSSSSISTVWPDACRQLGDLWRLPNAGNCHSFLGCPSAHCPVADSRELHDA